MANILLVDDEKEILEMVQEQLSAIGHSVTAVDSPQTALALLSNHFVQYDFLLCDVIMPSKNGIDFIKEVQRIPWFDGKIAIMSSYTEALSEEFASIGVEHVLRKPFDLEQLTHFFERVYTSSHSNN
jgi:two-component system, NtrC family, nitrogen regulation response regulator GlnG